MGSQLLKKVIGEQREKIAELQKTIVDSTVIFERNNAFSHKRILELEAKIEEAKRVLDDFVIQFDFGGSITAQRALINEARSILSQEQKKEVTHPTVCPNCNSKNEPNGYCVHDGYQYTCSVCGCEYTSSVANEE